MKVECGGCGRKVGDGYLCHGCTKALVSDLSDVAWLARELDTQLARLNTPAYAASRPHVEQPEPGVPGAAVQALPYDERASRAAFQLRTVLNTWWHADARFPRPTPAKMAAQLLGRIDEIRRVQTAWIQFEMITEAVGRARRAIDRPGIVRWLPCPSEDDCGGRIRVTAETIVARCDVCGWETDNLPWLGRMLRADEPALVTATDACHQLRVEGVELVPATIRKWVERGKVEPLACTIIGRRNLYDLDELRAVANQKRTGH